MIWGGELARESASRSMSVPWVVVLTFPCHRQRNRRDVLVAAALAGGKFGSRLWKADVEWVDGLMPAGSEGINHDIPIDGRTAVLTIQRE